MEKAHYAAKGFKMLRVPNQNMISLRGKDVPGIFQKLSDNYIHYCEMSTTNQVWLWEWCNCLIENLIIRERMCKALVRQEVINILILVWFWL